MKETYIFDYVNENEFRKLERSIKKYNMLAYKKLYFEYYPSLKEGNFLGKLISTNNANHTSTYELKLPTDSMFNKVHGDIILHYSVYKNQRIIMLDNLTPDDILTEGHQKELTTYKGVMVSKSHKELDMFKINLLNSMNKNGFFNLGNLPFGVIMFIAATLTLGIILVLTKLIIK